MIRYIVLFVLFSASFSMAFNGEECAKLFPSSGDKYPPYYAPVYATTMFPSTTSYFTSTGKCSMYAGYMGKENIKIFVSQSYNSIEREAARGEGGHLQVLSSYLGCNAKGKHFLSQAMQKNFSHLFPAKKNSQSLLEKIEKLHQQNSTIRQNCLPSG